MSSPVLAARLRGFGVSIFAEMTALALRHQAVNLGQGFPDFPVPEPLIESLDRAMRAGTTSTRR
jgi:aspartate/methionine/tyrosine aminotransferase